MKCRRCQELLSAHLDEDGGLSPRRRRAVDEHLAACGVCAEVRDDLVRLCRYLHERASLGVEDWAGGGARQQARRSARDDAAWDELERASDDDALGERMWQGIEAALDADEAAARRAPLTARSPARRFPVVAPAAAAALLLAGVGGAAGLRGLRQRVEARAARAEDEALLGAATEALRAAESRYAAAAADLDAAASREAAAWPESRRRGFDARRERSAGEIARRRVRASAQPARFEEEAALFDAWSDRLVLLEEAAIPPANEVQQILYEPDQGGFAEDRDVNAAYRDAPSPVRPERRSFDDRDPDRGPSQGNDR